MLAWDAGDLIARFYNGHTVIVLFVRDFFHVGFEVVVVDGRALSI